MTQSNEPTIEQMDKAIAVFDGLKPRFVEYPDKALNRWEVDKGGYWKPMEYHTSWDWLIPVIKKIKGMHFDILQQALILDYMNAAAKMNSGLISLDIDKAHRGVYDFLTWFNQQKQKDGE